MDNQEVLTKLKQSVQNARHCNMTPEYKEMAIDAELEKIDHLADKLLEKLNPETDYSFYAERN